MEATLSGDLGNTPLIVITRGKYREGTGEIDARWPESQKELVTLSSRGKAVIAEHSGHGIDMVSPELIVESVMEIVEQA